MTLLGHAVVALGFLWGPGITLAIGAPCDRHAAALELQPVGYWPADEGEGKVLHDLSKTDNPGVINHVPWDIEKKLLDFTGAYQWLEIPSHAAYQTDAFSLGAWVFIRSPVEGSWWPNMYGMLLLGNRDWESRVGIQLSIRKQETIDVVSHGKEDVLGTRQYVYNGADGKYVRRAYGKPLPTGQWQHLVYTFQPVKGRFAEPTTANLALTATVTASNRSRHKGHLPENAIDGKPETRWCIVPGAGPSSDDELSIQLDFAEETRINRIRLLHPPARAGMLFFSDGSSIEVPQSKDEWDARFPARLAKWVRYDISGHAGPNLWLQEFEVYAEPRSASTAEKVVMNLPRDAVATGSGSLYLNGQLVKRQDGIQYKAVKRNLQSGNDAYWWHQQQGKSGSLDGSVRDLIWFDRALQPREVERLHASTKPTHEPQVYGDNMVILGGRGHGVDDLTKLSPTQRRAALLLFQKKETAALKPLVDSFVPVLSAMLNEPNCRMLAVQLLAKLGGHAAQTALQAALPRLIAVVGDRNLPESERAEAALALATLSKEAGSTVGELARVLEKEIPLGEEHLPRVEERLRNALTQALLAIDPNDFRSKSVLTRTWAVPLLDSLDLSRSDLDKDARAAEVRTLARAGKALEALQLHAKLPAAIREPFFSNKNPNQRDYTATSHFNGAIYKVGEGIAWKGVEKVPPEEFKTIVASLANEYPAAADWRQPEYEHLYRVPITKITSDGREQKVFLEGKEFILDGLDQKCRGWSIFVDELGYIHLMGGQHNAPNTDYYIPGSWEKMGVSRDPNSDSYPLQMYWVSREPEKIETLAFAGRRNDPQAIPAGCLNYMVLGQSPRNETILYGRTDGFGWQCWGMFRYHAAKRRWSIIGGDPFAIIESAKKAYPEWLNFLHDNWRGKTPDAPSNARVLVWAWQPPFYNFCRDDWGARFDKTGRLHVRMQISGLDAAGYNRLSRVYAWSDDLGDSFHRADGSAVRLPLTINPAPEHNAEIDATGNINADVDANATRQWRDLWLGLLQQAGYRM